MKIKQSLQYSSKLLLLFEKVVLCSFLIGNILAEQVFKQGKRYMFQGTSWHLSSVDIDIKINVFLVSAKKSCLECFERGTRCSQVTCDQQRRSFFWGCLEFQSHDINSKIKTSKVKSYFPRQKRQE